MQIDSKGFPGAREEKKRARVAAARFVMAESAAAFAHGFQWVSTRRQGT